MRHGTSSTLLADGVTPAVVQKQMRHSDARITLGIYGHVVGNEQRDAVENRNARIEKFARKKPQSVPNGLLVPKASRKRIK
jgi:integrase